MNTDINLNEARVYVGTYHKYNCGSIEGAWMDLSDYNDIDELYLACSRLHKDEDDPEYMFQDYENIPEGLVDESGMNEKFFLFRDAVEDLDNERFTAFLIWCENHHKSLYREDVDDLLSDFDNDYIGKYESEEDYARQYIEDTESNLSDFARQYFDYEAYARDLFSGDHWCTDGYVFRG